MCIELCCYCYYNSIALACVCFFLLFFFLGFSSASVPFYSIVFVFIFIISSSIGIENRFTRLPNVINMMKYLSDRIYHIEYNLSIKNIFSMYYLCYYSCRTPSISLSPGPLISLSFKFRSNSI